ncbi:MAG: hypothetical protein KGI94_06410 [Paracoccaceae bacterium]|nr:hypothetical protein [Paracoccaceae bacterium]MDE3122820.1 hypothetical protein [Paracoccaceae bacterium]MDE3238092.1 hypothetical protein [Paracoccaceae bacterium]
MKSCSILCVIGYGMMLCFGYLALSGAAFEPVRYMVIYEMLAAAGFATGMYSWLRLRRGY